MSKIKWKVFDKTTSSKNLITIKDLVENAEEYECIGIYEEEPEDSVLDNNSFAVYVENESIHIKAKDVFGNIVTTINQNNIPQYIKTASKNHIINNF